MMNPANLISVIMPCFNAERFVDEAVKSVFSQSDENVELLIVDDGSTDRSRSILKRLSARYGNRMRVFYQQNRGPYPARNFALREARGGLIAFLDADDFWHPDCLYKLRNAINATGADLAYCGWQNIGEGVPGRQPYIPPRYETEDTISLFLRGCPWPIHAALMRRSVIDAVDGFSERYRTSMDYDFWLRISTITRNFVQVPEVLAFYRWHDAGQISSVKWEQVLNSWKVRRDFIRCNPERVTHIACKELHKKIDGYLLKSAYTAYWKRDLISAQRLFRRAMVTGCWTAKDMRYLLPSLLPQRLYCMLVNSADHRAQRTNENS